MAGVLVGMEYELPAGVGRFDTSSMAARSVPSDSAAIADAGTEAEMNLSTAAKALSSSFSVRKAWGRPPMISLRIWPRPYAADCAPLAIAVGCDTRPCTTCRDCPDCTAGVLMLGVYHTSKSYAIPVIKCLLTGLI